MKKDKKELPSQSKTVALVNIIVIAALFLGIAMFLIFAERPDFSGIENRKLDEFPAFTAEDYFAGRYTADITHWFTDTVPHKDDFKNIIIWIRSKYGIPQKEFSTVQPSESNPSDDVPPDYSVDDPFENEE